MVRGVIAATAVMALAFGTDVSGFDGQRGHGGEAHSGQPAAHSHTTSHSTSHTTSHATVQAGAPKTASPASHGHSTGTHGNSSVKTNSTTTRTAKTTTTASTTTLTPVQQKLSTHTNLANKLRSRLPTGTDVVAAAGGFRNLGQFVAAVNVSHNLRIPFDQLRADMVQRHMSLGQSIQDLRPTANATHEAERAENEAKTEIEVETRTTTTTTKTRTPKRTSGHE